MRLHLTGHRKILAKVVICALVLTAATRPAKASIPTHTDIVWIGIAIGAIGAGIGIGIYYAVHHGHSLTGCTVSGPGGLELQGHGDQPTYALACISHRRISDCVAGIWKRTWKGRHFMA